jgi:thiamine biosynthesis lipoprotein
MSIFIEESEVSRLNRSDRGEPIAVSPELIEIVGLSAEISEMTEGAFDITVAPLLFLWNQAASSGRIPRSEEREYARDRVGMALLECDPRARRLRFLRGGMAIDLGGIGKGYALDRAAAVLREHGVRRALLNFGGNILALGSPHDARWEIGIRDAGSPSSCVAGFSLDRGAVSTSGDYERGIDIRGTRYSHIIDPRTGQPAQGLLSVTVIDSSAARADALSTALYVMGREKALRFAEEHSIAALLVSETDGLRKSRVFLEIEKGGVEAR